MKIAIVVLALILTNGNANAGGAAGGIHPYSRERSRS